ncbi:MAG: hypothetical protein NC328_06735 [Muribaculum sp.]|nr:hypothetical protein [Muribaculum sp.]
MKKLLLFVSVVMAVACCSFSAKAEELFAKNGEVYALSSPTDGYFIAPVAGTYNVWGSETTYYTDAAMTNEIELGFGGYWGTMPDGKGGQWWTIKLDKDQTVYFHCATSWGTNLCIYNDAAGIGATGTISGINAISVDAANAPVYNLNGVKVANGLQNAPAGLYIVNGKKVVVK